jgi:hypothetical protein
VLARPESSFGLAHSDNATPEVALVDAKRICKSI